jgi:hypothetical protein
VIRGGNVTKATADLTIDVKPREVATLELTDPSGKKQTVGAPYKNPQALPGTWHVKASGNGYDTIVRDLDAPPDETTVHKLDLQPLGGLAIRGTPAGAALVVTTPSGQKYEGGLPWEAQGLPSGAYHVLVARDGYSGSEQMARVAPGRTTTVEVQLRRQGAAGVHPAVSPRDPPPPGAESYFSNVDPKLVVKVVAGVVGVAAGIFAGVNYSSASDKAAEIKTLPAGDPRLDTLIADGQSAMFRSQVGLAGLALCTVVFLW